MKWVTYYSSLMDGVSDITVHESKQVATRFFNRNYWRYFELADRKRQKLPCGYGYFHRKFCGVSVATFKKLYPELADKVCSKSSTNKEVKNDCRKWN